MAFIYVIFWKTINSLLFIYCLLCLEPQRVCKEICAVAIVILDFQVWISSSVAILCGIKCFFLMKFLQVCWWWVHEAVFWGTHIQRNINLQKKKSAKIIFQKSLIISLILKNVHHTSILFTYICIFPSIGGIKKLLY